MQNESQCDLDRKAAKILALSSNNLDKYEYLTRANLGLKLGTIEQAKFEYSPLGKIFNKGLSEDNKKEVLLKSLKNIEDKNEEQLKLLSNVNKTKRYIKSESDYKYENNLDFHTFYRDFQNFKDRPLESKHNDISKFYRILKSLKIIKQTLTRHNSVKIEL